jgi:hypothetical protein
MSELLEVKQESPERIYGVSQSIFSVSRYYGGCKAYGETYHYDANTDSLVRMDVWRQQIKKSDKIADEYAKKEREKWQASQEGFAF